MKICRKCNNEFPLIINFEGKDRNLQNRKFCLTCSPFKLHNTKNLCKKSKIKGSYEYVKKFRHSKKNKAVEYLGGKCKICGYNKCKDAMHFHHLDPSKKEFGISSKTSWGFSKIVKELDKCILVCSNCHAEIHAGLINLNVESPKGNAPFCLD